MYLPCLEFLSFKLCRRLTHFPVVMQKMDKPLIVLMIGTAIKKFPNSIGNLTGLEYIDMSVCKRLNDLSSSFLLLPILATLRIDGFSQVGKSFKRFKVIHSVVEEGFSNLVTLHLSGSNLSDEDLHIILECFPKLEDLNVSHSNFASIPQCIKGSYVLRILDVSYCRNLKEIPELPLSIQKVDARYCESLTSKASSVLWSMVYEEKERIQVVMPATKIPNWFYLGGRKGIPLFWARNNFPVIALAFELGEVKENDKINKDTLTSKVLPGMVSSKSHVVGLHLFIDGKEIYHKDYGYCSVGEHHMLVCDLRILFNDEEWKGLNACFGRNWKTVQVQCESQLIINRWGLYVYKQKTNHTGDNISFDIPHGDNGNPDSSIWFGSKGNSSYARAENKTCVRKYESKRSIW